MEVAALVQRTLNAERALLDLQASQLADSLMIRALIASHPDPSSLRTKWSALYAYAATDFALSTSARPEMQAIDKACAAAIARWSEQLEQDLGGKPSHPGKAGSA